MYNCGQLGCPDDNRLNTSESLLLMKQKHSGSEKQSGPAYRKLLTKCRYFGQCTIAAMVQKPINSRNSCQGLRYCSRAILKQDNPKRMHGISFNTLHRHVIYRRGKLGWLLWLLLGMTRERKHNDLYPLYEIINEIHG